jgi:hypothetical protein
MIMRVSGGVQDEFVKNFTKSRIARGCSLPAILTSGLQAAESTIRVGGLSDNFRRPMVVLRPASNEERDARAPHDAACESQPSQGEGKGLRPDLISLMFSTKTAVVRPNLIFDAL